MPPEKVDSNSMSSPSPSLLNSVDPELIPPLDKSFLPAVLVNRQFRQQAQASGKGVNLSIGLEQPDGTVTHATTTLFEAEDPRATGNFHHVERLIKFLLWSRGGCRVYLNAPSNLADQLVEHYTSSAAGRFDSETMGNRIYGSPLRIINGQGIPEIKQGSAPLGRHLNGCRIGFDLGGSDRKVAAVIDGEVVFSEETVWDPVPQPDPQYHIDGIMESLQQAARHLPRVDAIGGSAAGVYVNNRVRVASLFRGIPEPTFKDRVEGLFLEIKKAWNNIPFEVVNDGEVTALAGSMALKDNGVLGIAMGTSTAAGYVNPEGNITSWLNELAFAPVDYQKEAHRDEWSGDIGCGVQYFSQQAVARLVPCAGIDLPHDMPFPEQLKQVQTRMADGCPKAKAIYETLGSYLGFSLAHYADFYQFTNVLVLGRVTSGPGGQILLDRAGKVIERVFPELSGRVRFHIPDEREKRHGQAIAAASLPFLDPK